MTVSWVRYGAAAALVAVLAGGVGLGLPAGIRSSLWVGAGLALSVQGICYAALWLGSRTRPVAFLAAWAGGILIRLVAVVTFGIWGARSLQLDRTPALLAMVSVLFVLILLEPVGLGHARGAARA